MPLKSILARFLTCFDSVNKRSKRAVRRQRHKHFESVIESFFEHFSVVIADTPSFSEKAFALRHDVYCSEFGYEAVKPDGLESDGFDRYAISCCVLHRVSKRCVGTIRVVLPKSEKQRLPLEVSCSSAIEKLSDGPWARSRDKVAEISRLAVARPFRTMPAKTDSVCPIFSEACKLIPIALYFAANQLCHAIGIDVAYVMMEPRLARRMALIGIQFRKLGPVINYHGERAAFCLTPKQAAIPLRPSVKPFYSLLEDYLQFHRRVDELNQAKKPLDCAAA